MLIGRQVAGVEHVPGKLIAVEVSPTAISRAGVIDLPHDSLDRVSLKSALGGIGVKARRIHFVGWNSEQIHRIMSVPPMTAADRSMFLEREMAREEGGARAVSSQVVRQVEAGDRKDEVLVVAAPLEWLERMLTPFRAAGSVPRLLTTSPLALVKAAQALSPTPIDRPTVIVHWGFSGLTVAVVSDGVLSLARQIPHLRAPGLDPLEWVETEIQRSIHHHAQVSKGERVKQLLLGNSEAAMEPVFSSPGELEARLGLPVLNLNEALRALLPDGAEEETGVPAGAFLPSFGAALLASREVPNLLPREIVIGQRSRQITRGALTAAACLALTLGGSFWAASREAGALRHTLERERVASQALLSRLSEIERIEGERQRVRRWIRLLKEDPLGGPPLADALKELSRFAPERLRLERLSVSRDDRGYAMRLGGSVKQADPAHAQLAFNRLYFGLRDSPFFYDVTLLKGGVTAVSEAPSAPEHQLAFELTLRLKEMGQ